MKQDETEAGNFPDWVFRKICESFMGFMKKLVFINQDRKHSLYRNMDTAQIAI